MNKVIVCWAIFHLVPTAGCQHNAAPLGTPVAAESLDVHAAPRKVRVGMTEAQVRAALGKPHKSGETTTKDEWGRVTKTSARLIYWNPEHGYDVAVIQLGNGRVKDVQVKTYPKWALEHVPMGTRAQVRQALGKPSQVMSEVVTGKPRTYWVYTDRKASQMTLLLMFGPDGRVKEMVLGPNRDDWDNGRIR